MARDGEVPDGSPAGRLFEELRSQQAASSRLPVSTYRLQLHARFRFDDARRLAPYLASLGVTELYASPYLKATPGSTHGYDCIDHQQLNPEIGSESEYQAFCAALGHRGLGLLLDFVPNHMGIQGGNALWQDVLENGPASLFAPSFDIDWHPVKEELQEKVLLPILGDPYGAVLERGELRVRYSEGSFSVDYFDWVLPISVRQYGTVLRGALEILIETLSPEDPALVELQSILTAIEHLPGRSERDPSKRVERNREKQVIKRRLDELVRSQPKVRERILDQVTRLNGTPGDPRSFDALDGLLNACSFRLAHWRVAGEEINYRRFFDINTLAAVRVEDPDVFAEAHALILRWIGEGRVTGLRIDHPDGLFDPAQYFLRLQEEIFILRAKGTPGAEQLEGELRALFRRAWQQEPGAMDLRPLYVVVEKIQGGRERIPEAWAIHGTTGYRFANMATGLFVDPGAERRMTQTYERFIGRREPFGELLYEKKKLVLSALMASELNVLARELNRISEMNRHTRDFTLSSLRRALIEFVARFPVYRSYVDDWRVEVDERDIRYIEWTIRRAKIKDPNTNASVYDFLERILLRRYAPHVPPQEREVMLRFAMKLQQLTGPAMAKGLEDTVFYLYNRLVALNEVGGEPERFGTSVVAFHLRNQERAERWPAGLLTSSTHDTKRSEDVRARLCALSEFAEAWTGYARRWARLNRRYKSRVAEGWAPCANDEYLFYQTLLGIWPMGALEFGDLEGLRRRLKDYMLKAAREGKTFTSWLNPDPAYEAALLGFIEEAMKEQTSAFLQEVRAFKDQLERPGQFNSLALVVLKLASPGTTDVYQGCELWDLSLVDPDNRRPVDFAQRATMLEELDRELERDRLGCCRRLFANMTDGRAKLLVLSQGLRFRRRRRVLFQRGGYLPLDVSGPHAERAIAFARTHQGQSAVAVAPRLLGKMLDQFPNNLGATEVRLPDEYEGAQWIDVFSGQALTSRRRDGAVALALTEVWSACPVALLERR